VVVSWVKKNVSCSECGSAIMRRTHRPKDRAPIKAFFCSLPCKAAMQRRAKPVTEEWLRQKYEIEGLGCPDIAEIVGRDAKSVWKWLKDFGIPTRPRGADERQHFTAETKAFAGHSHSEAARTKISAARMGKASVPAGPSHHLAGKAGPNHPRWKGGLTPERQAFYSSDEWKAACVTVWHNADAKCQRCGLDSRAVPAKSRRFHVHHVVSFQIRELRADANNLRLLCAPCHRFVHSKKNINREYIGEIPCSA